MRAFTNAIDWPKKSEPNPRREILRNSTIPVNGYKKPGNARLFLCPLPGDTRALPPESTYRQIPEHYTFVTSTYRLQQSNVILHAPKNTLLSIGLSILPTNI